MTYDLMWTAASFTMNRSFVSGIVAIANQNTDQIKQHEKQVAMHTVGKTIVFDCELN